MDVDAIAEITSAVIGANLKLIEFIFSLFLSVSYCYWLKELMTTQLFFEKQPSLLKMKLNFRINEVVLSIEDKMQF